MTRSTRLGLTCLSLLALTSPASAGRIRPMPMTLRIEGYLGEPPAGVVALAHWRVAVEDRRYRVTVTKLTPSPSAKVAYWDIVHALEPLPIAMTLLGKRTTLAALEAVPAGQAVTITGSFEMRRGPATLLVHSIEPLGPPAALPSPASTPVSSP